MTDKYIIILIVSLILLSSCAKFVDEACRDRNKNNLITLNYGESKPFFITYSSKCNPSGINLEPDKKYSFSKYTTVSPLIDGQISSHPKDSKSLGIEGWNTYELNLWTWPGLEMAGLFRPKVGANWYELIGKVGDDPYFSIYRNQTEFTPKNPGELYALANDFPWFGRYTNNQGHIILYVKCTGSSRHQGEHGGVRLDPRHL